MEYTLPTFINRDQNNAHLKPGDIIELDKTIFVTQPLFYTPQTKLSVDDLKIDKICTIRPFTQLFVIATFPKGVDNNPMLVGSIVLVPEMGLWWCRNA